MKKNDKLFLLIPLFCILCIIYILYNCSTSGDCRVKNYNYKWKVAVVYDNGDKDTLNCNRDGKGEECELLIKENSLVIYKPSDNGEWIYEVSKEVTVATNVRSFKIL